FAAEVRRLRQRIAAGEETYHRLPRGPFASLATVAQLVELFEGLYPPGPTARPGPGVEVGFVELWADLLQTAWLRERDSRPLVRALEGERALLRATITTLATREAIPALAPGLRRRLQASRGDGRVALALGTQGQPGDGPRLLAILEQQPDCFDLALAVVWAGHRASAERARQLWQPSGTIPQEDGPRHLLLAQWRELGSARLVRRLRRVIRDEAARIAVELQESGEAEVGTFARMVEALALLGWPEV